MNYKDYEKLEKERIERNIGYANQGVIFMDIRRAYIEEGTRIGEGTFIYPDVILEGNVSIGKDCRIGPSTRIKDSNIGDRTEVQNSVVLESSIGNDTKVGPFAYIRPDSNIGSKCKVGDFVEVKNSSMGDGTKAAHLTYIGDSDVGRDVNLGCGVVFVNYDGTNKHRSVVEDGAFIGCNTNLVSPVHVQKGAFIAAGSTITENVPEKALAVARARQVNKEGWLSPKDRAKQEKGE